MTKDVLVSISGKHIDIMDDPARGYEVGEEGIEVVTPANYYCRNGKHYILYDEVLEGMAGTIKNKIKITGTDCLEIMKSGVTSSHMVFEKNKKNLTYYKTPYGQMLVGVNTKNMEISVDEDQIGVKVSYELDVNHEPMADCRINMSIVPRNSKGVHAAGYPVGKKNNKKTDAAEKEYSFVTSVFCFLIIF